MSNAPQNPDSFNFGSGTYQQQVQENEQLARDRAAVRDAAQSGNIFGPGGWDDAVQKGLRDVAKTKQDATNFGGYAQGANDFANYTNRLGQGYANRQAPDLSMTVANQNAATAQQGLGMLQQTAAGNGPSQSGAVLQQGLNAANQNAISLAHSGGGNAAQQAAAMRGAQQQFGANAQQTGLQAAQLKSQEQLAAMGQIPGAAISAQNAAVAQQLGIGQQQLTQEQLNQSAQLQALGLGEQAEQANAATQAGVYGTNANANLQQQQINNQQNNAMLGAGMTALGTLAMFSDIRAKRDIHVADDKDDATSLSKNTPMAGAMPDRFGDTRMASAQVVPRAQAALGNALSASGAGLMGQKYDAAGAAKAYDDERRRVGLAPLGPMPQKPPLAQVAAAPPSAAVPHPMVAAAVPAPMPAGPPAPIQTTYDTIRQQYPLYKPSTGPGMEAYFGPPRDPGREEPLPMPAPYVPSDARIKRHVEPPIDYEPSIVSDRYAKEVTNRLMSGPPRYGHDYNSEGRQLLSGPAMPNRNYHNEEAWYFNQEQHPAGFYSDARAKTHAYSAGYQDAYKEEMSRRAKEADDQRFRGEYGFGPESQVDVISSDERGKQEARKNGANEAIALPHRGVYSDERAKGGLGVGDMSEADHFLASLKPYTYRYKDPSMEPSREPTGGEYLGVMAQNVERVPRVGSQIVKDTPRGKVLEGGALQSAIAAGLGRLHERVALLEQQRLAKAKETTASSEPQASPKDEKKRLPK